MEDQDSIGKILYRICIDGTQFKTIKGGMGGGDTVVEDKMTVAMEGRATVTSDGSVIEVSKNEKPWCGPRLPLQITACVGCRCLLAKIQ